MTVDFRALLYNTGQTDIGEIKKKTEIRDLSRTEYAVRAFFRQLERVFSDASAFRQYLNVQSRMLHLSAANVLLVISQRPTAANVRTEAEWKRLMRSVRDGEYGIVTFSSNQRMHFGDDESLDGDLSTMQRFDILQTHGLPLTPIVRTPFNLQSHLVRLMKAAPVPIEINRKPNTCIAIYDTAHKRIYVNETGNADDAFFSFLTCLCEAFIARHSKTYRYENHMLSILGTAYIVCKRVGSAHAAAMEFPDDLRARTGSAPAAQNAVLDEIRDLAYHLTHTLTQ